jgi:hypothetical protein
VSFRVEGEGSELTTVRGSNGVGLLEIEARPREVLVVPASAVLYAADGPYVLAAAEGAEGYTKRAVAIGRILDSSYAAGISGDNVGATVILSGLREGEHVVVSDTFFIDAERRLGLAREQVAPKPMAVMQ